MCVVVVSVLDVNMRMGKAADAGRGDSHLEGLISGALGCSSRPSAGLPSLGGHRGHPPPRGVVSVRSFLGRGGSGRELLAPPRAEMKAWKKKGGRSSPPASPDFTTATQSKLPPSPRGSQRELPASLSRSGQGSWPFGHGFSTFTLVIFPNPCTIRIPLTDR